MPQFLTQIMPQCTGDFLSRSTERMCTFCDLIKLFDNIVKFLAGLAPVLAILFIIGGAFIIITSGGSPDRLSSGKKMITAAVVGLAVVLGAWVIVSTVFLIITGSNKFYGAPLPWYAIRCTQLDSASVGGRYGDTSTREAAREQGSSASVIEGLPEN